jgi:hypothetical protein
VVPQGFSKGLLGHGHWSNAALVMCCKCAAPHAARAPAFLLGSSPAGGRQCTMAMNYWFSVDCTCSGV